MRLLMIGVLMLGWAGAAQAQVATNQDVLRTAVADVIRPNMLRLDAGARGLESAMMALCAVPSPDAVAIAGQQFGKVVAAFGRVEFLRLGPVMENDRADRLLFWPDRDGMGLQQVQAVLAEEDPAATALEGLQAKSPAVQGLGALDYVLFGTGAENLATPAGAFRCAYGQTIAGNIAAIAKDMVAAWYLPGGIADHVQAPQPDHVDYGSAEEALAALVGLLADGLEGLRDQHLLPLLARDDAPAQRELAVFRRSGMSIAFVRAKLEGMAELVVRSGMARAVGQADRGLGDTIDRAFREATSALDRVTLPVEAAVADAQQAAALDDLLLLTTSLHAIMDDQLPAALGLNMGFSTLDGD